MGGYNDPDHQGNDASHHTGKPCIEEGCGKPAGTAWSPHWCFACNVKRIDRINAELEKINGEWKNRRNPQGGRR